ncbi:MAG: ISL3 family transposase, partial [Oscillospiraceae bacterium]|nr:ISL3 family transposase [Oscillospiraceae bacterium]
MRIVCNEAGRKAAVRAGAQKLPFEQARKFLRISHTSLTNIANYYVDKAIAKDDLSQTTAICVDETSFKRGQSYVTVVTDAKARRVIDVEDGRGAAQVVQFSQVLEQKGGDCAKITQTASDMSGAYLSGIDECFPNAVKVVDKFHVSKLMRDAMDKVCRKEQGKLSKQLKSGKKLLMIPEGRMSCEQKEKMTALCKQYPDTGRAFRMVQALDSVYSCSTAQEAEGAIDRSIDWLKRSRLEPMKAVANTLSTHRQNILHYFVQRLTNAVAEGINSL